MSRIPGAAIHYTRQLLLPYSLQTVTFGQPNGYNPGAPADKDQRLDQSRSDGPSLKELDRCELESLHQHFKRTPIFLWSFRTIH